MTEFELNELINGQIVVLHQCFQAWAVATTSLVVAAYMAGNKMESGLRWMILVLYLLLALGSIGGWCNSQYVMAILTQRLIDAGTPYPFMPFVAQSSGLVLILAFFVGTFGSIAYMIKTGKEKSA